METLVNVLAIAVLVFGFGFVVFWHELGHFLAAKAVGIKVEQFAVGFGQAMLCWRKGIGTTVGTSAEKYRQIIYSEWEKRQGLTLDHADKHTHGPDSEEERKIAAELGLGETEYRLNWIPLGGYVKMMGQDDLDPTVKVSDPRAYNNKSVPARMLVVSAGVIMNVILAAILFMALFLWGYQVQPAVVGTVAANSPAAAAGMKVGDRILSIDGTPTPDFGKVQLNVVLLREGATVPLRVLRDGKEIELQVRPVKPTANPKDFLAMGVGPVPALRGPNPNLRIALDEPEKQALPDALALRAGDVITAIDGVAVPPEERGKDSDVPSSYARFDAALQASDGRPVRLTVRGQDGASREVLARPFLEGAFGARASETVAGISPRSAIQQIRNGSSAVGKLLPGDVVTSIVFDDTKDVVAITDFTQFREQVVLAGGRRASVTLTVDRGGTEVTVGGITPNIDLPDGGRGLGVVALPDVHAPLVARVADGSAAARAGLPAGATLLTAAGQPAPSLLAFRRALIDAGADTDVPVTARLPDGTEKSFTFRLTAPEHRELAGQRLYSVLPFGERIEPRRTSNPVTALGWGVTETRDLILQGYITIKRMIQGSVSASNLTGPVGIFHAGGMIATTKSPDWLLWFLAMISANLAVVNFLPIPIVDGGLFVFLIVEKLMGRPLSPRIQSIAQIVGLAIILGVFLFVTYHDIARLLL